MKTKNKMFTIVEIAIVLCSVFLVAIPAIAADQTTQEVSATASEDDFVLGIYGNANEDDTIDMRDVTYTKLVIFGKKPETELADAYYDGEVDVLDVVQIKLIILGRESELTVIDTLDRTVTVKKPVKRIVVFSADEFHAIRVLGEDDKIVGISDSVEERCDWMIDEEKPLVGKRYEPDPEAVLAVEPDLVIGESTTIKQLQGKLPEDMLIALVLHKPAILMDEMEKLGYILNKKDRAKHYLDDFHAYYIDLIKAGTEGLSEEEKPKVYVEYGDYKSYGGTSSCQEMIDICGGLNIFADLPTWGGEIDKEAVIEKNPDIIIRRGYTTYLGTDGIGYQADDPLKAKELWDSILGRSELAEVEAVKIESVYIIYADMSYGPHYPIALAYWVSWFHPDLFGDLDPGEIHKEFLSEWLRVDYDLDKHGVFVYHPEQHPDGK